MSNLKVVKKEKKKSVNKSSKIFISCVSVFFIFYMSGYIYQFAQKQEIPSARVVYGSIGTPEVISGIVIRDESVYKSDKEGSLFFYVGDNERVKKGEAVCSVRNAAEVAQIESSLSAINSSIINMQKVRDDYSIYNNEVKIENEKIKTLIDEGMYKLLDPSMQAFYNLSENVNKHMGLKNQMLLNEGRGSLASISQERVIYENMLSNNILSIKILNSGTLSYVLDGFEDKLTKETMYSLTKEETIMRPEGKNSTEQVKPGDPIFKIVESNEWYIAAYIPSSLIETWTEDTYRTIYVMNNTTEAYRSQEVFINKITNFGGDAYVVMKCTKGILDYISDRNIKFKITEGTYEGIKIPNTAIVDITLFKVPEDYLTELENGMALIKKTENGNIKIPVKIKGYDDGYSLILQDFSGISLGDTVLKPDTYDEYVLEDIKNSKGVYMLNTGIAEFKAINIDESTISNSLYTILDKTTNPALRVHDNIVSDAKNVSEGQTIF